MDVVDIVYNYYLVMYILWVIDVVCGFVGWLFSYDMMFVLFGQLVSGDSVMFG